MTKELLEQYQDICGELAEMEEEGMPYRTSVLWDRKREVDDFIDALPWRKKKLVLAVLQYGNRWNIIRRALGSLKSSDALRKEYKRILEKF